MKKAKTPKKRKRIPVKASVQASSLIVTLPLTGTTSKIRVKRPIDGFESEPVACRKKAIQPQDYLEWQIGYDTDSASEPTALKQVAITKPDKGQRYGYELVWLFKNACELGLIAEDRRQRLLDLLSQPLSRGIEEAEAIAKIADTSAKTTATAEGFERHYFQVPSYFKSAGDYAIQIKIAAKQRAVGNQAMIYVHLPLTKCLALDGGSVTGRTAKQNECVQYLIDSSNSSLVDDCILAFAHASATHRLDLQRLLALL